MAKTHTENQRTGRALCGAQLTDTNHGWSANGETCQKCANASEQSHQRRLAGTDKGLESKAGGSVGGAKAIFVEQSAGPARRGDKTAEIKLRASPYLKASIEAAAENRGVTVSAWMTWLAERELGPCDPSKSSAGFERAPAAPRSAG